jgi:TNF receptor-associated protein 1
MFLKEGICQDYPHQEQISKLLMFETSGLKEGDLSTLDEYVSRSSVEQKQIYYLVAPDRKSALASPYYEAFKRHDKEVLFLYNTIDDFVMSNLRNYNGRELVSAEDSKVDFNEPAKDVEKKDDAEADKKAETEGALSTEKAGELCEWIRTALDVRVREVKTTDRLFDSPAVITDHESGAMRRMMKMVDHANFGHSSPIPPQVLLINPKHPVIVALAETKDKDDDLAKLVTTQLMDNALVAAGLMDDTRSMVPRLNELLLLALKKK